MSINVRFAPSPTGKLHVGNVRAAIVTWLFARKNGGNFMLRIDDTDLERSKEEYVEAIQSDLTWLGLTWDRYARQSERWDRYNTVIADLKAKGRLYPCYETEEELNLKRKSLMSRGLPPIYDRASLGLSDAERQKFEAEGRKPHWRFKLLSDPIEWNDLVRGEVKFHGKDLSDPVLIREDGSPLYHLCSVIDDIDFEISHVIRGEDHVANTATHIQMFEAISGAGKVPQFAHYALLSGKDGGKLSKRLGAVGIQEMRDEIGLEPMTICSLIAKLGTSDNIDVFKTLDELVQGFDFSKFSRTMARFDEEELDRLNAKLVQSLSFEEAKQRLHAIGLKDADEEFWNVARRNITKIREAKEWWDVTRGVVSPVIDDADFTAKISSLLPDGTWDETTWSTWLDAIKANTDRKGKMLFMPIRQALTGMEHGPELKDMLPLIGPEKAKKRLQGIAA